MKRTDCRFLLLVCVVQSFFIRAENLVIYGAVLLLLCVKLRSFKIQVGLSLKLFALLVFLIGVGAFLAVVRNLLLIVSKLLRLKLSF